MSCYFRHMKDILNEAGIQVTRDCRRQLDQAIHDMVGVGDKDCRGIGNLCLGEYGPHCTGRRT